jgi:hypothetical protein
MTTKFALQTLAFAGILAVSGLPAFAADMAPANPVPSPAIHSDTNTKATVPGVSASANTKVKADATVAKDKTVSKDKKVLKDSKDSKKLPTEQVAQRPSAAPSIPAAPAKSIPAPAVSTGINGSAGATVSH